MSTCPGTAPTGGTQRKGKPLRPAGPVQRSVVGRLSPSPRSAESSKAPSLGRGRSSCQRPHGERRLQGQRQQSVLGQSPTGSEWKSTPGVTFLGAIALTLRAGPAEIPLHVRGRARLGSPWGLSVLRFIEAARPLAPCFEPEVRQRRGLGEEPHGQSQAWPRSCPAARPRCPPDELRPRCGVRAWGPCLAANRLARPPAPPPRSESRR